MMRYAIVLSLFLFTTINPGDMGPLDILLTKHAHIETDPSKSESYVTLCGEYFMRMFR